MFRIQDDHSSEIQTVSFREWLTADRAQRREWSAQRRVAKATARTASDARAAERAAKSASHRGQAGGLSGGGGAGG